MAGMGISTVLIQLMARWSSDMVLRYGAEEPLQGMSDAYREGHSTVDLGETAKEVLRQLGVVESEASHDKRLIYSVEHEVALLKDIEDVQEKDLGYNVNIESGAVHRPVVWQRMLLRSVGGLFVAGPLGSVTSRSLRCRHRVLWPVAKSSSTFGRSRWCSCVRGLRR